MDGHYNADRIPPGRDSLALRLPASRQQWGVCSALGKEWTQRRQGAKIRQETNGQMVLNCPAYSIWRGGDHKWRVPIISNSAVRFGVHLTNARYAAN